MTDNEIRLQAEIDMLKNDNRITQYLLSEAWKGIEEKDKLYETIKSKVIREFAGKLKKKTYPFPCAIGVENAVTIRAIDELVEEMVGDT